MSNKSREFLEKSAPYWDRLFKIALSILKSESEAEDAVQDSLIKALTKYESFRGDSSLYTWLVRIVLNHSKDMLRKNKIRHAGSLTNFENDGQIDIEDTRPNQEKIIELNEDSKRLMDAVNSLDQKYRELIMLRYFENYSYNQIAVQLKLKEGTVKSRMNAARQILKKHLFESGMPEELLEL